MSRTGKQIKTIQNNKLRKILHHAYDHSAYYRKVFEEYGIGKGQIDARPLCDFPTLDKETMMANFDDLVTVPGVRQDDIRRFDEDEPGQGEMFQDRFHIVHSSGSTGIPRYFIYDEDAWGQMLLGIIRGALWDLSFFRILKLLAGGIRILYIAAVNGRYGGAMAVGSGIDGLNGKRLFLDVNTPLHTWSENIRRFNPNIVIGYPSALKILAEITERGDVPVDVKRVISCGEPLSPGMRMYFEKIFKAVTINVYGASESLALGVETSAKGGMYLFDDLNCVEIQDEQIYITSLYNFAQPLIRYHLSDKLVLRDDREGEGGPFTRANVLLSREEEVLWFEDDTGHRDFLHPLSIEGFCLEGLIDFQFRQTGKSGFEMMAQVPELERRPAIEAEMHRLMRATLEEKHLDYVNFTVGFVEEILPDPRTGKKQLILAGPEKVQ